MWRPLCATPAPLSVAAVAPRSWDGRSHTDRERFRLLWGRGTAVESQPSPIDVATHIRRTAKLARLEAVLLVADAALSPRRLAQLATLADATEARTLIGRLNAAYDAAAAPYRVERVASGYRLLTL